jgi:NADPH:quinone reductase-like Zn-dependent oxidoreductase
MTAGRPRLRAWSGITGWRFPGGGSSPLRRILAAPTSENLQRLGALLADGSLRVPVHATYDLAQAPDALAALSGQHTQGKLAIKVS